MTRITSANISPRVRARACSDLGNLPARIEMKMMLSTPSTISSIVSVIRLIHN